MLEKATQLQMGYHSIKPIGGLPLFFDEQESAFTGGHERGSDQVTDKAQISTQENAFPMTWTDDLAPAQINGGCGP